MWHARQKKARLMRAFLRVRYPLSRLRSGSLII